MDSDNSQQHQEVKQAQPKSQLQGLEGFFDTYLREKAPFQLPNSVKEFLVKYGPWISLVFLILGAIVLIPLLLITLGLTAVSLPFQAAAGTLHNTGLGYVSMIISLVVLVMEAVAIPALLKRKLSGWHMIYYASLLSAAGQLIDLNIIGAVISLVIGMYVLFQIRSYYQ